MNIILKPEWLLTFLFLIPGWVFFKTEGDLSVYFLYQVPKGQFLYLLSKLCGLYAFFCFGLQLLQGLLASCGYNFLQSKNVSASHRHLGGWVLILLLLHISLFVVAVSLRNGHFAYKLLLPNFFESYYPAMVSWGLIAGCLLLLTVSAAIFFRSRRGLWLWGHRLAWPAFFLALYHSYSIGSETRIAPMPYIFALMLVSMLAAMLYRTWLGIAKSGAADLKGSGQ
ncbi:MAG: hypothetical protein ACU85E_10055 [Gammaproteobacteria bacterium]